MLSTPLQIKGTETLWGEPRRRSGDRARPGGLQRVKRSRFQNLLHVFVRFLHGLGGDAHAFQNFGVGVGVLQSFPLELDGGQGAVDPAELLLVPLFPLQGLEGNWTGAGGMGWTGSD